MAHDGGWWRYIAHDPSQGRPQVTRHLMGRVLAYARPYWKSIIIVLGTILAISLLDLLPIWVSMHCGIGSPGAWR